MCSPSVHARGPSTERSIERIPDRKGRHPRSIDRSIHRSIDGLARGRSPPDHLSPRSFHHTVRVRVHESARTNERTTRTHTHRRFSPRVWTRHVHTLTYEPNPDDPKRRPVTTRPRPIIHIHPDDARACTHDRGKSNPNAVARASISIARGGC